MKRIFKSNLFFSLVFSGIFLIVSLSIFGVFYDQSDDYYIALAFNNSDNIVFVNYFLGLFVSFIQNLFPNVNIFAITQIVFAYVSAVTINYVFFDKYSKKIAVTINLFLNVIIAMNNFTKLSFTQLSGLILFAGVLMLVHTVINEKNIYNYVYAVVLFTLGALFRFNMFFIGVGFAAGYLAVYYLINVIDLEECTGKIKKYLKTVFSKKIIFAILAILLIPLSLNFFSNYIYNHSSDFEDYIATNKARSSVEDYPILTYADNQQFYKDLGLSENDYNMIKSWFIDGGYDNQTLNKLSESSKVLRPSIITSVKTCIKETINNLMLFDSIGILVFFTVLVCCAYFLLTKFKNYLIPFAIIFFTLVFNTYLYYIMRIPYRVVYGIYFLAIGLILYSFDSYRFNKLGKFIKGKKTTTFVMPLLAIIFSVLYVFNFRTNFYDYYTTKDNTQLYNYIEKSDRKFVVIGENYDIRNSSKTYKNPLSLEYDTYLNKCVSWGMVYYKEPFFNKLMANVGITNFYNDLIDNNSIYLIDSCSGENINKIVTYLNEHNKSLNVKYVKENIVDSYGIFSIVSE